MDPVPVDSDRWRFEAGEHVIEDKLGRRSLRLRSGIATLADADVRDGVVELELSLSGARGFMGPTWRVRDKGNLEWFFLRPHQSGNPDATQYTPAFNGSVGWQLYHGDRYTVPVAYRFDEWSPLRVAFRDERAEIFVGDLEAPALVVDDLKRVPERGSVGISVGGFAPAWISRFAFSAEPPTIAGPRRPPQARVEGAIREWSVSDAIAEASLADGALGARPWTRQQAEPTGLLDLARANVVGEGRDTALARVVLHSEREQTKRLDFGFATGSACTSGDGWSIPATIATRAVTTASSAASGTSTRSTYR